MTFNRWAARLLIEAQLLDALTFGLFFLLFPVSIHTERNPLVNAVVVFGGVLGFMVFKIGVALIIGYRTEHNRKSLSTKYLALHKLVISAAIASGVVGAAFNVAAIADQIT